MRDDDGATIFARAFVAQIHQNRLLDANSAPASTTKVNNFSVKATHFSSVPRCKQIQPDANFFFVRWKIVRACGLWFWLSCVHQLEDDQAVRKRSVILICNSNVYLLLRFANENFLFIGIFTWFHHACGKIRGIDGTSEGIRYQMLYIAGANYLQFHGTVITIIITNKTLNSSTIYHNKSIILSDTNQTKEEEHKKKTKTIPQVQCFWWITKMSLHPMFWVFVCVSVSFCVKCCNVLMKTPIFTNK